MKRLFTLMMYLFAIHLLPAQTPINPGPDENGVWKVIEELPLFPGCEDLLTMDERSACSNVKLLKFIYDGLQYPAEAKRKGVEGEVVIMLRIYEDGFPADAKVMRGLGYGLNEEALRVVTRMQEEGIFWTPAKYQGNPVKVLYNISVKFKL